MEQEPNPELLRIVYTCPDCEEEQIIEDEMANLYISKLGKITINVWCVNGCEDPYSWDVDPAQAKYYSYLTDWRNAGGQIPEIELKGVLLGEPIEVEEAQHWGRAMLKFLQVYDPQPQEFNDFRW